MSLEPVKVFRELSNGIATTKSHFEEFSVGVSKLLKLKVSALPRCLREQMYTVYPTGSRPDATVQDELLYQAVGRKPLTQQQLTNLTVTSSTLFLRLVVLSVAPTLSIQE